MNKTVHHPPVHQINSNARTANAYHRYGCATKTTIATTIRTRRRTVWNAPVQKINSVARRPAAAYRRIGNATVIRTVRTVRMNRPRVVNPVCTRANQPISNATIINVYRDGGVAITITIAAMVRMRRVACRGIVRNRSSGVGMDIVYGMRRDAMGSFIAMISQMRRIVMDNAKRMSLSVLVQCFVFISKY